MESNFHLAARQREQSWRALRRRRASPPRVASSGSRQKTFRAALEQAEQQLRAAAVIGYDSRPLNLFYGLSQGGRALAAASPLLLGQDWRLQGHGLHHVDSGDGVDVTAVTIEDDEKKDASFRRVSLALGSPQIRQVSLGELWPLMYETTIGQPLGELLHPPLEVFRDRHPTGLDASARFDGAVVAIPAAIMQMPADQRPEVMAYLSRYPALRGAVFYAHHSGARPAHDAEWPIESGSVTLRWETPRRDQEEPEHLLDQGVTIYRRQKLVMPHAPGCDEPLHPLMVWWQVLFALSMLARYEPARWTKMIDVDSSPQAVAIEYVLDTALDAVPDLLDEAFDLLDPPARPAAG